MPLLALENLRASNVTPVVPWELPDTMPPEIAAGDKENRTQWSNDVTTKHCFFSGYEGLNGSLRVSSDNEAHYLHALVADWDVFRTLTLDVGSREKAADELGDLRPTWIASTRSGGARFIWILPKKVHVACRAFRTAFLKQIAKRLSLHKLLPGWDENAWNSPVTYYELGTEWTKIGEPVSQAMVEQWMFEASRKVKLSEWDDEPEIPLERVRAEIEKQYPGRWSGSFVDGARGVVVFDPSSINPTAAILTPKGFVTFGQEKTFYNWRAVLGDSFVEEFVRDKVGRATQGFYYIDGKYWSKTDDGVWHGYPKDPTVRELKHLGLHSEVEEALRFIERKKVLAGTMPALYVKSDTVDIDKKQYLNTSRLRVMEPAHADDPLAWGQGFPWHARFLDTCFKNDRQKTFFLAWWKRAYESAYRGELVQGHVLFLAGDPAIGKTYLSNRVVGDSMGGHTPASQYLLGNTQFNDEALEYGLMSVDDVESPETKNGISNFGTRLKQFVVNDKFLHRRMYTPGVGVSWKGRIIVTFNVTDECLRILPMMDSAMADKFAVLHFVRPDVKWNDNLVNNARVKEELPHLLRWLIEWEVPEELGHDARLGFPSLIDEEINSMATAAHGYADVLDYFDVYWKAMATEDEKVPVEGTAVNLLMLLKNVDQIRQDLRDNALQFGKKLSTLESNGHPRVAKGGRKEHKTVWKIFPPGFEKG